MQLLKITTTPIKIKVVTEKATFEEEEKSLVPDMNSSSVVQKAGGKGRALNEQNKNTLDAQYSDYKTQKGNYGNFRKDRLISKQEIGMDSGVYDIKFRYGQQRTVSGNENVKAGDAFEYRGNSSSIESNVQKLKKAMPDDSWEPDRDKKVKKYVPGKISFEIEEMAEVDIEYTGGFNYFPKSSDPEYKEESED